MTERVVAWQEVRIHECICLAALGGCEMKRDTILLLNSQSATNCEGWTEGIWLTRPIVRGMATASMALRMSKNSTATASFYTTKKGRATSSNIYIPRCLPVNLQTIAMSRRAARCLLSHGVYVPNPFPRFFFLLPESEPIALHGTRNLSHTHVSPTPAPCLVCRSSVPPEDIQVPPGKCPVYAASDPRKSSQSK